MRCVLSVFILLLFVPPVLAQEFVNVSQASGVADGGLGKGAAFVDVNGDDFVDLYVSNKGGANKLYLNNGDGTFRDVTAEAGAGVDAPGFTMGSVFGDCDNDGDVDLYVVNGRYPVGETNKLYLNNQNDRSFIELAGLSFGSKVALCDGGHLVETREVRSSTGFCAQEPAVAHFGVQAGNAYMAKITTPDGKTQNVAVKGGQIVKMD